MTVGDLIKRLEQFDPKLPVCLADWSEEYLCPSTAAAEEVSLQEGKQYAARDDLIIGTFVCIG